MVKLIIPYPDINTAEWVLNKRGFTEELPEQGNAWIYKNPNTNEIAALRHDKREIVITCPD